MKLRWTQEDTTKTLSNLLAICGGIALLFILRILPPIAQAMGLLWNILTPLLYGFIIAYVLSKPVSFFEALLQKSLVSNPDHYRIRRVLAIIITYTLFISLIGFLLSVSVPQLASSISSLVQKIPSDPSMIYIPEPLRLWIAEITNTLQLDAQASQSIMNFFVDFLAGISKLLAQYVPQMLYFLMNVASQFYNLFFGLILSFYLLRGKEKFIAQIQKVCAACLPKKICTAVLEFATLTNSIFLKYICGQLIDALVVGVLCFLGMTALRLPYAFLMGSIVCVTNVIPIVGPFIGAIPGVLILLVSDTPMNAVWFAILIFCLQQLDSAILVPLIVGGSTGISGFWTIMAVLVGGSLYGVGGILISVPTFTLLYILASRILCKLLKRKDLPTDTTSYNSSHIPIK